MSNRLLTPAMAGLLDRIQRAGRPPLHSLTAAEARRACQAAAEVLEPPRARLARVEDLHIPGGDRSPRPAGVDAASNVILPVPLHFTHRGRVMSEAAHAQPSAAEASALAWSTDEKG